MTDRRRRHASNSRASVSPVTLLAMALIACAIVLGGGGSPAARAEMALQIVAAAIALVWMAWGDARARPPLVAIVLCALVALVPLLQLIPLPPAVWHGLPGREIEREALTLIGREGRWMPLSLVPGQTLASLVALGPPLLMLVLAGSTPVAERHMLLLVVVAGGLASLVIGAGQVASAGHALRFYDQEAGGWLTGFQAGRNLAADVLLIAIMALAAIGPRLAGRPHGRWLVWGGLALLAVGTVLTGSRSGVAMLILALFAAGAWILKGFDGRKRLLMGLAGVGLMVAAAFVLVQVPATAKALDRFATEGEGRVHIWQDAWQAALAYWPAGGGVGGFATLFLPYESLETLTPAFVNRAHNDYLEWLIEAGAAGIIVLVVVAGLVAWRVFRAHFNREVPGNTRFFAIGTIGIIAAHSVLDYPLRSMSLASLLALAVGMLCVRAHPPTRRKVSDS